MEKNEIRGYEPLVEELKQLIHKKQYHVVKSNKCRNYQSLLGNWRRDL